MRAVITFLLLASAFAAQAQLRLTNVENYTAGSHSTYILANADSFKQGAAGAGVTWDFSGLSMLQYSNFQQILKPSNTAYAADFPGAELVEKNSDSTFVFLRLEDGYFKLMGYVDKNSNLKMKYDKPALLLKNQVSYGDKFQNPTHRSYTMGSTSAAGGGMVSMFADAYGTLKLPGKTYYNVLRVRIEQNVTDTLNGFPSSSKVVTYSWFDKDHRASLLKYDSIFIQSGTFTDLSTDLQVLKEEFVNTSINPQQKATFQIFATPEGRIYLQTAEKAEIQWSLYSIDGKHFQLNSLRLAAGERSVLNLSDYNLPKGIYFARFSNGTQETIQKLVIR